MSRSGLAGAISELADIVYVDAPNSASGPIPEDVSPFFEGPYFEWWNAHKSQDGSWSYDNWDKSLSFIQDVCRLHGPFDGVIGFSQGGAAAALLVAMQRSGLALQDQPRFRFCICFAGIRVRDAKLDDCFDHALRGVPSLHIIGDKDPVKRLTNALIASFDRPVVITHPKGHVIPSLTGDELKAFKVFLESQQSVLKGSNL